MPDKKLLNALVYVPWGYAVLWYFATNDGGPRLAAWANWGWLAIIAIEAAGFALVQVRARKRQPPPSS